MASSERTGILGSWLSAQMRNCRAHSSDRFSASALWKRAPAAATSARESFQERRIVWALTPDWIRRRQTWIQHSIELPRAEAVLVLRQVHVAAAKAHALQLQPRALLQAGFVLQFNGAARAHYALPRQRVPRFAQQLRHLPVKQRVSGGGRHLAVGEIGRAS